MYLKPQSLLLDADLTSRLQTLASGMRSLVNKLDGYCGSPLKMALEHFQGRNYDSPEVDV